MGGGSARCCSDVPIDEGSESGLGSVLLFYLVVTMTMRQIRPGSRSFGLFVDSSQRRGRSNPVIVALLSGIFVTLVVLVAVILLQGRGDEPNGPPGTNGPSGPAPKHKPKHKPKRIDDPKRIKETLQVGKTYRTILKVGLEARVEDKDWGVKTITNLVYEAEMALDRTIKSNDGHRIVELRHFDNARSVKLLTDIEDVSIEFGPVGMLALGALDYLRPGTGATIVAAKPIAEAILARGADEVAKSTATKAFAHVDSLSGKTVRITYIDGVGIESVEPVDCTLTDSERSFVNGSAVVSDYYIMPQLNIKVGGTWTIDGGQFGGFIDPSLRGVPSGEIVVVRDSNHTETGKEYATLRIQGGYLKINESDDKTRRIGTFTPRGSFKYSISDRIVESAALVGQMVIEQVSKDHLLFEASFKVRPKVTVNYSCKIK